MYVPTEEQKNSSKVICGLILNTWRSECAWVVNYTGNEDLDFCDLMDEYVLSIQSFNSEYRIRLSITPAGNVGIRIFTNGDIKLILRASFDRVGKVGMVNIVKGGNVYRRHYEVIRDIGNGFNIDAWKIMTSDGGNIFEKLSLPDPLHEKVRYAVRDVMSMRISEDMTRADVIGVFIHALNNYEEGE